MRLKDLLQPINESPLPDGGDRFDKNQKIFNARALSTKESFDERIKYVKKRAHLIGKGSSRSAFEIEFEGRNTVLKVAHNTKGVDQNTAEMEILKNPTAKKFKYLIPLVDYDRVNKKPTWIQTEYASWLTTEDFVKYFKCGKVSYLIAAIKSNVGQPTVWSYAEILNELQKQFKYTQKEIFTFEKHALLLTNLVKEFDLQADDFKVLENWGIFKNKPVIIDVGFTSSIKDKHYSGKR